MKISSRLTFLVLGVIQASACVRTGVEEDLKQPIESGSYFVDMTITEDTCTDMENETYYQQEFNIFVDKDSHYTLIRSSGDGTALVYDGVVNDERVIFSYHEKGSTFGCDYSMNVEFVSSRRSNSPKSAGSSCRNR